MASALFCPNQIAQMLQKRLFLTVCQLFVSIPSNHCWKFMFSSSSNP
ncbi:hypothetical protein ERO13_D09G043210v2 [Gossypium hirsutum]|nr:hypothetical protein ERO13_D09G043210v2 [Gossypium hirsutum]